MTNMQLKKSSITAQMIYKQIDSLTLQNTRMTFFYFKVESDSTVVNLKASY
jgi:hypothetical protein